MFIRPSLDGGFISAIVSAFSRSSVKPDCGLGLKLPRACILGRPFPFVTAENAEIEASGCCCLESFILNPFNPDEIRPEPVTEDFNPAGRATRDFGFFFFFSAEDG
jgi:hypothetical protein